MAIEKNWKYYTGLSFLIYSFIPICTAELVFFLPVSKASAVSFIVVYLASGEVTFLVGVALLGKPFVTAFKARIKAFFFPRREVTPPKPVSRARHRTGVILFLISFIPYPAAEVILFMADPVRLNPRILLLLLLFGDAVFIASLFVLGGEFWERLKKLFEWQGKAEPTSP